MQMQLTIAPNKKGQGFILVVGKDAENSYQEYIYCPSAADVSAEVTILAGKLEAAIQRNRG